MLHFAHCARMAGFPVAGICASSSRHVRHRADSSMARWVCSKVTIGASSSSSSSWSRLCVRAPGLLPTGAIRADCIKTRDHFKETRCAPAKKLRARLLNTHTHTLSSLSESPAAWLTLTGDRTCSVGPCPSLRSCSLLLARSAPPPHAVQTVGATAGTGGERGGEKRRTGPLLCSSWAVELQGKPGADLQQSADRSPVC